MKKTLLKIGKKDQKTLELAQRLALPGKNSVNVSAGARAYLISLLGDLIKKPLLVITLEENRAKELASEIGVFTEAGYLPKAAEMQGLDDTGRRISALNRLTQPKSIVCMGVDTLADKQPAPQELPRAFSIKVAQDIALPNLAKKLVDLGFEREYQVEVPGQFSIRGNICDIYPAGDEYPARLEFFGDKIEEIRRFSFIDQRSKERVGKIKIEPAGLTANLTATIEDYLRADYLLIFEDRALFNSRLKENNISLPRSYASLDITSLTSESRHNILDFNPLPFEAGEFEKIYKFLNEKQKEGYLTVVNIKEEGKRARFKELLSGGHLAFEEMRPNLAVMQPLILLTNQYTDSSFSWPAQKLAFISDKDIFIRQLQELPAKLHSGHVRISSFEDLKKGDFVVHINHGIASYEGLETKEIDKVAREYLKLAYAEGDRLFVPVTEMDRISRYVGADEKPPKISRLNSNQWSLTKSKVKKSVRKLAVNLLNLYAERNEAKGFAYSGDAPWQQQLEDDFPFEETKGQLSAIEEVKQDMQQPKPMDRLICGDVGYGKTEVALRAAFKAVLDEKQVLFLVPTTILAQQHFNTFSSRVNPYPINVQMLSRFKTRSEQIEIVEQFNEGKVDILIGTHRLLQKDVKPRSLGLIIVDEEQRFGVNHKEKLRTLKTDVDVISLSATPIPRTLQMALAGIRDLSVIETPPDNRHPIVTHVGPYETEKMIEAVKRELARSGQVFYLYNEVRTINSVADKLGRLIPEAKIAIAHGQLKERELEKTMLAFLEGRFNVLLTTTIIESGIDIPKANTLIVDRAEKFGLAQLYQIRGRVGRSAQQAYAYLFYRTHLTENAVSRLKTLAAYTSLGSGYKIALRDLEIRGAGNLLGAEQSGHVAAVGFDLYTHLLQNAVDELRGAKPKEKAKGRDLPVSAYIPKTYIVDEGTRIDFYQRLASAKTEEEFEEVLKEMADRFGPLPKEVESLRSIALLKFK